ncbi:MAG: cadherin-like beta sandwich domain-containing protein [Clostridia bacterium]|nr:cadherin-like beta sandwich domain-containing protein [Clostridia bacterium]
MRLLARLLLPLWVVVMLCSLPLAASAEAAATVAFSSSTLEIGQTLTVTLNFTGPSVGAVDATLSYDASVLEFVSGNDASGGGGLVQMTGWASSEVKSLRFTLTFKALKAGSSTVRIDRSTVYAWDESLLGNPTAGATVTVRDKALSQNADLKSITLSAGELYPAFSANTTVYNVTVNHYHTSVNLSAVAADNGAKVEISGSSELQVGANKRTITVTAPGGAVKVYTVTITRRQATTTGPSTTAKPTTTTTTSSPTTTEPGITTTVETNTETTTTPSTTAPDKQPLHLTVAGGTYLFPYTESIDPPAGLMEGVKTVDGISYPVWRFPEEGKEDFCVVWVKTPAGETGWYCWDTKENTMQRYVPSAIPVVTTPLPKKTLADWAPWIIAGGLALLCAALGILVAVFHRRSTMPRPRH